MTRKRGSYFYAEYKGIRIKASQSYQIDYLIKLLKLVEKRDILLHPSKIKRIEIIRFKDNTLAYYTYKTKVIELNSSKKLFPPKNKTNNRKYLEYSLSTLLHEIVHAYDVRNILSNLFLDEYVKAVEKAYYHLDDDLITLPSRKKILRLGLVDHLNNNMSLKVFSNYFKGVANNSLPTLYSLTNVHEFTAEIISLYLTKKSYIRNKVYKRLCEKALTSYLNSKYSG